MASVLATHPAAAEIETPITVPEPATVFDELATTHPDVEELNDADDEDTESLLTDELSLEREEYIVPLPIEGRQLDMYSEHIKHKKELLERFLKDPREFEPLTDVEEVLDHLRAIETHIDLVFAEAESSMWQHESTATQAEFAAQFGMENSTKFRFLQALFHQLRDHRKDIVLVTEQDDDQLFHILEMFCKTNRVNYSLPTKGRHAESSVFQGNLSVTIFPSHASPITRSPDLIICLDGVQQAASIRRRNWAGISSLHPAPILHLVIPRTVGHIERYISPTLNKRERIHTTLASLAQMRGDMGKAIVEGTPRAQTSAAMVAGWFTYVPEWFRKPSKESSWPLPSIGSIKEVIEFQSQVSQTEASSPMPERNKRSLVSTLRAIERTLSNISTG